MYVAIEHYASDEAARLFLVREWFLNADEARHDDNLHGARVCVQNALLFCTEEEYRRYLMQTVRYYIERLIDERTASHTTT